MASESRSSAGISPWTSDFHIVFCPNCQHRPRPRPESPSVHGRYPALHFLLLRWGSRYCCSSRVLSAKTKAWLVAHKLKLNDDKTVIMEIRPPHSVSALGDLHIMVGEECITLSEASRNLGVFFDEHFNMQNHVQKICRSAYAQLRNIAQVRSVLPQKTAETLVHAFITSKLDYCNALMYGLPACIISKLRRLQNSAARVVTRSRKFDHITPILRDLYWLPPSKRITFKAQILTYRALHGLAPDYIADSNALLTCTQFAVCKWMLIDCACLQTSIPGGQAFFLRSTISVERSATDNSLCWDHVQV